MKYRKTETVHFVPHVVKNRQKDIFGKDDKIISMYARALTTRQISEQIVEIYGIECSESFISDVTDKILKDIEEWQHRPLESIYPVVFIDACHFSIRDNGIFDVTLKDLTGHGKIDIKCLRCINVIRISFQSKLIRTEQIDA